MKKKTIIMIIFLLVIITISVVIIINYKGSKKLIKIINIEEGCYFSTKDEEHLICLTNNHKIYSVLNKYNTYYNDIYYYEPPKDDPSFNKYNFDFEYQHNSISIKLSSNDNYSSMVCSVENSRTLNCNLNSKILDEKKEEKLIYEKIDKEFNEEIIKKLPIFDRNKEYEINFNGEIFSCNLTWLYSIVNIASGTTTIKQCLEKQYGEEFLIGIPTDSNIKWLIKSASQKKATDEKFHNANLLSDNAKEALEYNNKMFGYNVTASIKNEKEIPFGFLDKIPYDPYNPNYKDDKIIIKISNDLNTHVSTMPEPWELQFNKKYKIEMFGESDFCYYKFLNSESVEYKYDVWDPKILPYTRNGNQITIEFGYPDKDVVCTILSDTKIHCSDSPYNNYEIK